MVNYEYKDVTSEEEWTRARRALGYLDLADHNGTMFSYYKDEFLSGDDEALQSRWIATSGKGFPVDDSRVLKDWYNDESHSEFFHLAMKTRDPDWTGRNLFLEYVSQKLVPDSRYLESGEPSARFVNFARLCGFDGWKESDIDGECCVSDYIFSRVYPAVLTGLYHVKEMHPRKAVELCEMFCFTPEILFMLFERIPSSQHLLFLIHRGDRYGYNIWRVGEGIDGFCYSKVVNKYIIKRRYDLIRTLFTFGLTLQIEPLHWLQSIYKDLWKSQCEFTASSEFKEVVKTLLMEYRHHPMPYPPPRIFKEALMSFYRSEVDANEQLDQARGMTILMEMVEAYQTCGIDFYSS